MEKFDYFKRITQTQLKQERKWTDKLIKMFLKEVEYIEQESSYRRGVTVKLYKLEAIKKIEKSSEFKKEFEKTLKRKESSKKAIETKLKNILNQTEDISIFILKIKLKTLEKCALMEREIYYKRKNLDYDETLIDDEKLKKICVSYIRRNLTNYDEIVKEMKEKIGTNEAYKEYKLKQLKESMKNVYSELAESIDKYVELSDILWWI